MSRVTLRIFGMDCTACAPQIQHILLRQQGVQAAEVNYSAGKATLDADLRVLDWKAGRVFMEFRKKAKRYA